MISRDKFLKISLIVLQELPYSLIFPYFFLQLPFMPAFIVALAWNGASPYPLLHISPTSLGLEGGQTRSHIKIRSFQNQNIILEKIPGK